MVEHSVHTRSVICSSQIAATRPVGQKVKTPPFHGGNMGSIPVRVTKKSRHLYDVWIFFAPRASNRTHRVQSQAFCHRQMAAMRSIAVFGVVKRKCVGTRSRRSRRSIPVSHILYNVSTPGRRARRPGGFYGSRLGRMEDGGGKGRSCKTAISGISYVFTLFSSLMVFSSVFYEKSSIFSGL